MARMRQPGLKGIDNVMRNLNREVTKIKARSIGGMIKATAAIRVDMDKTPPKIPVDTGNLRASWFTTTGFVGKNPIVIMGFNAIYAIEVHERQSGSFRRPGSGPKFLESSLKRNKDVILRLIAAG